MDGTDADCPIPIPDPQLSSFPPSSLTIVPPHKKKGEIHTSPHMAHLELVATPWQQQHISEVSEQSAMLSGGDVQWESAVDAAALFPGSVSQTNGDLSQQLFRAYSRNSMPANHYQHSTQAIEMKRADSFDHWNPETSGNFVQGALPESHFQLTFNQFYPQPDESHHDLSTLTTVHNIRPKVEQDPFEQFEQETIQQQNLMSMHHQQTVAAPPPPPPPTPMMSDHSGDHEGVFESDEAEQDNEQPYAILIWRALLSSPNHCMQLSEIYEWIEQNTDKVKERPGNGWRNSVRHNLSMNHAFKRTIPEVKGKKGGKNTWQLAEDFLETGPQSTTRYRLKHSGKPRTGNKVAPPKPQRQLAGSKGGLAARRTADQRRSQRLKEAKLNEAQALRSQAIQARHHHSESPVHDMPYFSPSPAGSVEQQLHFHSQPQSPYVGLEDITREEYYSRHALAQQHSLHIGQSQQSMAGFAVGLNPHYRAGLNPVFGLNGQTSVAHGLSANHYPSHVDQIIFADLNGRTLFASDGDSQETASEPRTPSTTNSVNDMYGGIPHGMGIDHSPFGSLS